MCNKITIIKKMLSISDMGMREAFPLRFAQGLATALCPHLPSSLQSTRWVWTREGAGSSGKSNAKTTKKADYCVMPLCFESFDDVINVARLLQNYHDLLIGKFSLEVEKCPCWTGVGWGWEQPRAGVGPAVLSSFADP